MSTDPLQRAVPLPLVDVLWNLADVSFPTLKDSAVIARGLVGASLAFGLSGRFLSFGPSLAKAELKALTDVEFAHTVLPDVKIVEAAAAMQARELSRSVAQGRTALVVCEDRSCGAAVFVVKPGSLAAGPMPVLVPWKEFVQMAGYVTGFADGLAGVPMHMKDYVTALVDQGSEDVGGGAAGGGGVPSSAGGDHGAALAHVAARIAQAVAVYGVCYGAELCTEYKSSFGVELSAEPAVVAAGLAGIDWGGVSLLTASVQSALLAPSVRLFTAKKGDLWLCLDVTLPGVYDHVRDAVARVLARGAAGVAEQELVTSAISLNTRLVAARNWPVKQLLKWHRGLEYDPGTRRYFARAHAPPALLAASASAAAASTGAVAGSGLGVVEPLRAPASPASGPSAAGGADSPSVGVSAGVHGELLGECVLCGQLLCGSLVPESSGYVVCAGEECGHCHSHVDPYTLLEVESLTVLFHTLPCIPLLPPRAVPAPLPAAAAAARAPAAAPAPRPPSCPKQYQEVCKKCNRRPCLHFRWRFSGCLSPSKDCSHCHCDKSPLAPCIGCKKLICPFGKTCKIKSLCKRCHDSC